MELAGLNRSHESPMHTLMDGSSPRVVLNTNPYDVICIAKDGHCIDDQVYKHKLAKSIGMNIRDMRLLDVSPANRVEACFLSNKKAIIISIERLKLAIFVNEVLVFHPKESIALNFTNLLTRHLANEEYDFEEFETSSNLRFEHLVIDTALYCAKSQILLNFDELSSYYGKFRLLESPVKKQSIWSGFLEYLTTGSPKGLQTTRTRVKDMIRVSESALSKMKLQRLKRRVFELTRSLNELLYSEIALTRMSLPTTAVYDRDFDARSSIVLPSSRTSTLAEFELLPRLTGDVVAWRSSQRIKSPENNETNDPICDNQKPANASVITEERMRLDTILDKYIVDLGWISADIEDLVDQITNLESFTSTQLDIIRNRMMRFSLYLTIVTLCISIGALITGIFGMNLEFPNYLYSDPRYFYWTVSVLAVAIPVLYIGVMIIALKKNIF